MPFPCYGFSPVDSLLSLYISSIFVIVNVPRNLRMLVRVPRGYSKRMNEALRYSVHVTSSNVFSLIYYMFLLFYCTV